MRLPRLPFAILLAFLLAFAQQAAAVHALSHYASDQQEQQDKHLPGAKACEKCAAFAELSGAVAAAEAVFPPAEFTQDRPRTLLASATRAAFCPYRSRAPPSHS